MNTGIAMIPRITSHSGPMGSTEATGPGKSSCWTGTLGGAFPAAATRYGTREDRETDVLYDTPLSALHPPISIHALKAR
jgi:hypothetical protein